MQAKEGVGGRIGQTFELYKNNFFPLTVILFIIIFAFEVGFINMMIGLFGGALEVDSETAGSFYSVGMIIAIIIFAIGFLVYLLCMVPATIATIKGVQQAYIGETVDPKQNFRYAVNNFLNTLKTYWYIFAYVALIPAAVFIGGGCLFILGTLGIIPFLSVVGGALMIISIVVFIFFAIYRGIRTSFSLYNAVDKDEYTKINFQESLGYTQNQWWRILGNMLLLGLIVGAIGFVLGIFTGLLGMGGSDIDTNQVLNGQVSPEALEGLAGEIGQLSVLGVIESIIASVFQSLSTVLGIIFGYIFFKRLLFEQEGEIENITARKEEKITSPEKTEEL